MEQGLICLKKNGVVNIDVLDSRRRELVALGKAILTGNNCSIAKHVEKALDAGASQSFKIYCWGCTTFKFYY